MINKKAATFTTGFVLALFLAGFLLIVFFGGVGKLWDITQFLKTIPAWLYVVLGLIILFKWLK